MIGKRLFNLSGLGIALLMVGSLACISIGASAGNKFYFIEPQVSISHKARLYEPFTVTGKATARRQDLLDAELWLTVDGAVYLDGEDRWHGPLKQGETRTIQATFAFVAAGYNEVMAKVQPDTDGNLVQAGFFTVPMSVLVSDPTGAAARPFPGSRPVNSSRPGSPPVVAGGHLVLSDTTLLLNRSDAPRIEFIDSEEDFNRLQQEGLIPQDPRYEWHFLTPDYGVDFNAHFFIAYYDAQRPLPGQLILMENWGRFLWDDGTLHGQLKTYAIPTGPVAGNNLVSAVSVYRVARDHSPEGLPETLAYEGARSFEFQLNGASTLKTENLRPVRPENQP